ncbi:MAG: hypothetical protein ACOX81_07645 [Candidatus Heteroscillospira sp.]|jgi:hypothetical protein
MSGTIERVVSGFCKTADRAQRVICEYEKTPGGFRMENMDCSWSRCENRESCPLRRAALEMEKEL